MASLFVLLGVGEVSVLVGESVSDSLAELFARIGGFEVVGVDVLEVEVVDEEPGGHDVVLVDELDEGLDSRLLDELLLVEGAFGGDEVASDACDEQVGKLVALHGRRGTLLPVS